MQEWTSLKEEDKLLASEVQILFWIWLLEFFLFWTWSNTNAKKKKKKVSAFIIYISVVVEY